MRTILLSLLTLGAMLARAADPTTNQFLEVDPILWTGKRRN